MSTDQDMTGWKVFSQNGVVEIQQVKTGKAVIHWTGFDGSAFDDATNRKNAAEIVATHNSYPAMKAALALSISHIEHMAAWITKQNTGYSFESLGEDMPGILAAFHGEGQ